MGRGPTLLDQGPKVAGPAVEQPVHLDDVVGAHRVRAIETRVLGMRRIGQEPERGAPARGALDLDERHVLAAGEKADPFGGDGLVADGAGHPVRERAKEVARIHPSGV